MSTENLLPLTPLAEKALGLARKESIRFNHRYTGTEHLLLGIIELGQGCASSIFNDIGIDLQKVRIEVEKIVGTGPDTNLGGADIPLTPRVKKILHYANKEARRLKHDYIGTEHLLIGILFEGDGVAAKVLKDMNVNCEDIRSRFLVMHDSPKGTPGQSEQLQDSKVPCSKPKSALEMDQITCMLMRIDDSNLSDSDREELLKIRLAILQYGCRNYDVIDQSPEGLLNLIFSVVIPKTTCEDLLKALAVLIPRLSGTVDRVKGHFDVTKYGSSEERNFGIVLQIMTGAPVTKSIDFLSAGK